jgi:phosphate transport system substrate-binding protein
MRVVLASLLLVSLGMAQQAGPPKPTKQERAASRLQQDVRSAETQTTNKAAPTATPDAEPVDPNAVGTYSPEISEAIKRFPPYISLSPGPEGTLRITGSNTMAQLLTALGDAFKSIYPNTNVVVKQGGSEKGLEALKTGQCDMAAFSVALTAAEVADLESATGLKVFQVPIALGAICVFVNADNPLPSITHDQLNGIFAITHSRTKDPILRWNDLDPKSPLGDKFMSLYMLPSSHGTMRGFMDWVMPGENLQTITRYEEPGPSSVVNACCAYAEAMGISGYANRQPRARMVPVSAGEGKPAIEPSFRTIRDGVYPMTRPLTLVFLAPSEAQVPSLDLEFLRFAWSESGQDTFATLGVVVPDIDHPPALLGDIHRPHGLAAPAAK